MRACLCPTALDVQWRFTYPTTPWMCSGVGCSTQSVNEVFCLLHAIIIGSLLVLQVLLGWVSSPSTSMQVHGFPKNLTMLVSSLSSELTTGTSNMAQKICLSMNISWTRFFTGLYTVLSLLTLGYVVAALWCSSLSLS